MAQLTIFYDSQCPLCDIEMRHLRAADKAGAIVMEDIHAEGFEQRFPHIDRDRASALLHGQLQDGRLLLGLDVTHRAWSLAGRGWLTAPLRWPLLRLFSDALYRLFARHRYRISRVVTGKARCDKNCAMPGDPAGSGSS